MWFAPLLCKQIVFNWNFLDRSECWLSVFRAVFEEVVGFDVEEGAELRVGGEGLWVGTVEVCALAFLVETGFQVDEVRATLNLSNKLLFFLPKFRVFLHPLKEALPLLLFPELQVGLELPFYELILRHEHTPVQVLRVLLHHSLLFHRWSIVIIITCEII